MVDENDPDSAQRLTLVAANADWGDVLAATERSNVVLVIGKRDRIDDVQEQLRLLRVFRLALVGCVLVS